MSETAAQPEIRVGRFTIAVVPLEQLDLLEKNARHMRNEVYRRLVENVKQDGQLSQIPFCVRRENGRFLVLSGNHRVKAAKAAGLTEVPIVYTDQPLTRDQELAIQLSHNAIAGEDDPVILKQLWDELGDVKAKLYSGLDDKALGALLKAPMPALSDVRLDFRTVSFLLLPDEIGRVKQTFAEVRDLVKGDLVSLAQLSAYDRLLDALAETGASYNVTNAATCLLLLLDTFERHRTELSEGWWDPERLEALHKGWVPLSSVLGTAKVPAAVAAVIKQAVDRMVDQQEVEPSARWQALERMAGDYLAG